jgi:cobalt/nickel transport system ATP-binding protein
MVTSVFELKGASYRYPDGRTGIAYASLAVAEGESLVILGANASGKTTLLQLLGGLIFPGSGEVRAFGEPLTEAALERPGLNARFRQRVGILFQDADAMLFNPTVYDEIAFGPLQLDLSPDEVRRRVDDMIALFGLAAIADQPPHRLSGGERRKVALAAILAVSPEALLLDEPTSGLDPRSQRWFVELVQELRSTGKTLVTTTHDLHVADEIADRIIVLSEDHTIAAEGPRDAILTDLELLLSVNLVHEHTHLHDGVIHLHPHTHLHLHDHHEPA